MRLIGKDWKIYKIGLDTYRTDRKTYNEKKIFLFGTIIVIISILLISFSYEILFNIQFWTIFPNATKLILSYYIIGAVLKFADDSFDEGRFSKKLSVLFIVLSFVVAIWLSHNDKTTAIIFLSLVLATTLTGKTADTPFLIGSITYVGILIGFHILNGLNLVIFAIIFGALIADELLAEWAKKVLRCNHNNYNNTMVYFLRDRNVGIFTLLLLAVAGQIPFVNWLAWVSLDFGYVMVEGISRKDNIDVILSRKVFVADNNNIVQKAKTDIITNIAPQRTDIMTNVIHLRNVFVANNNNIIQKARADIITGVIPGTDIVTDITPQRTDIVTDIKPQRTDIIIGVIPGTDIVADITPQRTDVIEGIISDDITIAGNNFTEHNNKSQISNNSPINNDVTMQRK